MNTKRRLARVAGLWYLLMAVSGPIGLVYAPSQIRVPEDPTATTAALVAHDTIARLGVAASVVCQVAFIFLVLALERLFDGVDGRLARLMHGLVISAVPVALANELLVLGALEVAHGGGDATVALALLDAHDLGVAVLCGVFWGLWLLPFGMLAIRSGFIPRVLGALLIVGGCTYVLDATLALLTPGFRASITSVLLLPLAAGELSMVVWLIAKGVRTPAKAAEQTRPA